MTSSALQVARTGLDAQDTRMRVIANNLANVETTAYKRDRANFATLAYQDARVAGQQSSNQSVYATGLNLGTGVAVQSTTRVNEQLSLIHILLDSSRQYQNLVEALSTAKQLMLDKLRMK